MEKFTAVLPFRQADSVDASYGDRARWARRMLPVDRRRMMLVLIGATPEGKRKLICCHVSMRESRPELAGSVRKCEGAWYAAAAAQPNSKLH